MTKKETAFLGKTPFLGWLMTALALLVGLLTAVQPLLRGHLPWRADGLLHFYRLAQLERAVSAGMIYPRWLPDLGFGFGFPLFNFYAPLSYYVLLMPRGLGFSLRASLLVGYGLAVAALALGVYLWARALFGRTAGVVAAFAVAYSPYVLYNVHHRGALAEVWGLAWLSLSLWALHRLAVDGRGVSPWKRGLQWGVATLCYTALLLSHNILALVGTPLLVGYALLLMMLPDAARRGGAMLHRLALVSGAGRGVHKIERPAPTIALLLGLGLAAFFWLPAYVEKEFVQIEKLYAPADFDYRHNFLRLAELFALPEAADPDLVNPPIAFGLGWPQIVLAALAWWKGLTADQGPRTKDQYPRLVFGRSSFVVLLTTATVGLTLMALPVSRPVWDALPLLRFVQFPWRFLGPASVGLAVLAGAGAARLLAGRRSLWLPVSFLVLAVYGLPWLFPAFQETPAEPTPVDVIRFEAQTGALGTTSAGDYLPIWVQALPPAEALLPEYEKAAPNYAIERLDRTSLPAGATIVEAEYTPIEARLTVETPEPFEARFRWYYFPGWRAWLDGRLLALTPTEPHGLIAATIPAGRHELRLAFGDTPVRQIGWFLSLVSLVLFAFTLLLVARGRWQMASGKWQVASYRLPAPYTLLLCTGLGLFAVKWLYLDRADSVFRQDRFDGQQVEGIDTPLQVNFGNEMVLLGYDLPAEAVPADSPVGVALYWRVLPPVEQEYSVGLHLLDGQGRLYGQDDSQHPAAFPVTRWRGGDYGRDLHRLIPLVGTPPGDYTLVVSVYEAGNGRRLDVLDVTERPVGTTYAAAAVQITRPSRLPEAAEVIIGRPVAADLGGGICLLGLGDLSATVETGYPLHFTLYWQATAAPSGDYLARLQLVTARGEVAAESVAAPGRNDHPTSAWLAGEIVRDGRSFLVPAVWQEDSERPVAAGDYGLRLELIDESGQVIGRPIELGTIEVVTPARTFGLPEMAQTTHVQVGDVALLRGYTLSPVTLAPGETLSLTLVWEAQEPTDQAYTVFVHLLGEDERIYAGQDRPPGNGRRPTAGWLPGEVIMDHYALTIDAAAPSGGYRLEIGMYDPTTGRRLPVNDAQNTFLGDRFLLPTVIQVIGD